MSIRVADLRKAFDDFAAVDGVSFTVGDGEFVTLLGPSGSGKSTILRSIAGLATPDGGRVEIDGEDVTHIPAQERNVGFVFQHYGLFRHMTALENVGFGLRVRGVPRAERDARARDLLELVGLRGYELRRPSQLSGGQRQRVALARVLAPEPRLLLLDEPFGALDAKLRKDLRAWLRDLHARIRLTTLLVTHDQEEALEISDRVVVVRKGRIEQDASPREIFQAPATEFVAAFIGETNRVEGAVHGGVVSWGPLRLAAPGRADGAPAVVLFRPHDVRVTYGPEGAGVPGVVRARRFRGAWEAVDVEIEEGKTVTAYVPRSLAETERFAPGAPVRIAVEATHVFEAP